MKKMIFYTQRTKKELRDDVQNGLDTLEVCWASLKVEFSGEYEGTIKLFEKEYHILTKLKKRLDHSIYNEEDIEINTDDYFLALRWHYTDYDSFRINFLIDETEDYYG